MDFSKPMENKEKAIIKSKFGRCIQRIIENNKIAAKEKKLSGVDDHHAVTSLRKLAAASGIEFSIIQKISAGKRNPELSTIVAISDGLGISLSELFLAYQNVSEEELKGNQTIILKSKKLGKKKK